jgi:UDP-N-acetylglucosamine 1-carboxyvinyltransferase
MKLCEMGMRVSATLDGLWAQSPGRLSAVDVATLPHPGFATDFMPTAVALMAVSEGSAIVTENVYDGRFTFVDELARMGADVRTEGRHAVVRGVARLSGAPVSAADVRAGAALVLAGLAADGDTIVYDGEHVDRGYPDLPATLRALGADVERIP